MSLFTDILEYRRDRKAKPDSGDAPIYAGLPYQRLTNQRGAHHLEAYGGKEPIDWVMDCVNLIAETTSNAEFHFEKDDKKLVKNKGPESPEGSEQAPKDLVDIIAEPNPYMDYVELIELLVIDLLVAGEGFWYKYKMDDAGKPAAIYRLHPGLMDIIPGENELIKRYELRVPGKPQPLKLDPKEIIHFKRPNPHDPYRGLGVIAGGTRVYDVELGLVESEAQFFERGTKLSGVLQSERRVPDPVFKKIQRQFASMYSGARNAYQVAVLEAGLRFQSIQPTAAEAQFEVLSKLSRDRIAHMFRVPLPLLGNLENANYKMTEAQRVFDTKTMRPFLNKLEKAITRGLTDAWGVEFRIDYEYVMPDEDRLKLAESFAALPGVKVREVREQAGLAPLGDDRDDEVLNLPSDEAPNRPLAEQDGRPPKGENVQSFQEPGQQRPAGARTRPKPGQKAASFEVPDPLKVARDPTVDQIAHRIYVAAREAVGTLEDELIELLRKAEGKAGDGRIAKIKRSAAWRRFEGRLSAAFEKAAVEAVDSAVEQHRLIGFQASPTEIDAIAYDLANRKDGIKSISGTLKDRVVKEIQEGLSRGYEVEQIINGVGLEDYNGLRGQLIAWKKGQAETIALTEAAEYYNEGVLRVAEDTGHGHVLVLDGDDYDEPCAAANGEVWTVKKARSNRTEHPRCRRSFIPVVVGGEETDEGKSVDHQPVIVVAPGTDAKSSAEMKAQLESLMPQRKERAPEVIFRDGAIKVEPKVTVQAPPAPKGKREVVVTDEKTGEILKRYTMQDSS